MLQNLTGWHALVILTIVLLVFGSAKLPSLARSVGQSMRILKDEAHDDDRAPAPRDPASRDTATRPRVVDPATTQDPATVVERRAS